jgi:hypothetical protein
MYDIGSEQIAFLIAIALLVFWTRHISRDDTVSRLADALKRRMPVLSAETTRGKEGQFIRDGVPKRFTFWLVLVAAFVFAAVTVWLWGANLLQ